MAAEANRLAIVLHAHLPWVRASAPGEETREERWLFEALRDAYLPLVDVVARVHAAAPREPLLTLSISPTLACMLREPTLRARLAAYLDREDSVASLAATQHPELAAALGDQRARTALARRVFFEECRGDVVGRLAELAEHGALELATTAATHAFLPSLKTRAAVRAQLRMGRKYFARLFGKTPRTLWLPECGFDPKLDDELGGAGVRATVLEAHGVALARPRPPAGLFAPILGPSGVAYFPRHADLSGLLWSRERGYPGDEAYREFHVTLSDDAAHPHAGLKPFAVTGSPTKRPYDPVAAATKISEHAAHFVESVGRELDASRVERPIATVAFDAELFGHFFWEGPRFLEEVLCRADGRDGRPLAASLGAYLARDPALYVAMPATSSWGDGGFAEVWTHPNVAHLMRSGHRAEHRVLTADAAVRDTPRVSVEREARLRAIRELFLLQASDHAFMIRAGSFAAYAERMAKAHAECVERMTHIVLHGSRVPNAAAEVARARAEHPVFDELDEDAWSDAFDDF